MSAPDQPAARLERLHLGRHFSRSAAFRGMTAGFLRDVCWCVASALRSGATQWEVLNVLGALKNAAEKRAHDGAAPSEECPTEVRIHAARGDT